mmetsp:Transcript_7950/g.21794  ORF Transcript_7950/g.21794 Transcript_7950/m.21794 type:complete len:331 (+) Transcript_7950:399-1391(+)
MADILLVTVPSTACLRSGSKYFGMSLSSGAGRTVARGRSCWSTLRSWGLSSKWARRRSELRSSLRTSRMRASCTAARVTARVASSTRYRNELSLDISTCRGWSAAPCAARRAPNVSRCAGSSVAMKVMAVPSSPPRAVRPMRCWYTPRLEGGSKLITAVTPWKSTPRETPNSACHCASAEASRCFLARLRLRAPPSSPSAPPSAPGARSAGSSVAMRKSKVPRLNAWIMCHLELSGSSEFKTPACTPNCSRKSLRRNARGTSLQKTRERPGMRLSLSSAKMSRSLSLDLHSTTYWLNPGKRVPAPRSPSKAAPSPAGPAAMPPTSTVSGL